MSEVKIYAHPGITLLPHQRRILDKLSGAINHLFVWEVIYGGGRPVSVRFRTKNWHIGLESAGRITRYPYQLRVGGLILDIGDMYTPMFPRWVLEEFLMWSPPPTFQEWRVIAYYLDQHAPDVRRTFFERATALYERSRRFYGYDFYPVTRPRAKPVG